MSVDGVGASLDRPEFLAVSHQTADSRVIATGPIGQLDNASWLKPANVPRMGASAGSSGILASRTIRPLRGDWFVNAMRLEMIGPRSPNPAMLKGLTTSEAGATKAARYDPAPDNYGGCMPLKDVGRV